MQGTILAQAQQQGLSRATLKRAKITLGGVAFRKGFGPDSMVHWELPPAAKMKQPQPTLLPT